MKTGIPLKRLYATMLFAFVLFGCKQEHSHHHESMASGEIGPGSIYDLDLTFADRHGRPFALNRLSGRPVVFSMIYTKCDSICPIQAGNMLRIQSALTPDLNEKTQFLLMSFDPEDSAADLAEFGRKLKLNSNWTLLAGEPDRVRELAAAVGFQYRKNPGGDFSHSAAIYLLNEKGEVTYKKEGTSGKPEDFAAAIRERL